MKLRTFRRGVSSVVVATVMGLASPTWAEEATAIACEGAPCEFTVASSVTDSNEVVLYPGGKVFVDLELNGDKLAKITLAKDREPKGRLQFEIVDRGRARGLSFANQSGRLINFDVFKKVGDEESKLPRGSCPVESGITEALFWSGTIDAMVIRNVRVADPSEKCKY